MSQTKAQLIDPVDGTIVNADINASAAIAASKIADFVTGNVNNRVLTASGTANSLVGESGLLFTSDSNDHALTLTGSGQAHLQLTSTSGTDHCSIDFGDSDDNDIGEIRYTNSTNAMHFDTNATLQMTLDSSGRLLLGTTSIGFSAGDNFTVADSGHCGITVRSGTSSEGNLFFSDGTSGDDQIRGYVQYNHSNNNLILATNAVERMRIDSDGDVGIGTSTPPTGSFHIHLTETPELNLMSTQHAQNNNCKLNFGVGQSASVSGNTGARIEMNIPNSGGAMNGELKFSTNSGDNLQERMRIDSSGNVGIAVTPGSGQGILQINGGLRIAGSASASDTNSPYIFRTSGTDNMVFATGSSERMRITSSGSVGIGTQPGVRFDVFQPGNVVVARSLTDTASAVNFDSNNSISSGRAFFHRFIYNNSVVGNIYSDGSTTVFNTGSDYRLKENVIPISDGITRLKTLKPSRFNFKRDPSITVDGFLAHEAAVAVPEAVSGTKDEIALEDDLPKGIKKNDPIYQGIDHSKLVPLLTAALQEEIAKRESLETRVAALEAA